ncbi:diguanylate cyclase/phosphodiesterase (GGDEF & EAL domains) [Sulfurimonas gotlandica GD1]|uniref:Diguanylate cyclase/phosphodiesterase (GGDEF & EAL domains) n=1 Tax=Sulfurimonas gotlandica (strain DSM 19862 / JCM 16533 / GD1) TaxID=929558 RepID=B6BGL3_SULGG|nr:EAL domain-containing protein [Sulfurimonas gotlandica]EDZ62885.1 diguanylate cyclase/phosphodiesterase [Sulfurimonas gotlandica GD1]EHP29641.1 diguanylate cyclase/phosphodiesterase (GGDEF & EAL domains) [Sulfurimonas gotlandica GD1]
MKKLFNLKIITMLVWTLTVVSSLTFSAFNQYQQSFETARNVASANFDKDQAFRQWATTHGGVYVPVDMKRTPPSPYLSHMPERDVTTDTGKKLTLMNPAYMLRQMMDEYSGLYGAKGHITALEILNPNSAPDAWERDALKKFKKDDSIKEILELTKINNESYMRLIRSMEVTPGCLTCHGHQESYVNNKTAGGVSVIVPMAEIYELAISSYKKTVVIHIIFWFVGMILFRFVYNKERKARYELEYFANHDSLTGLPNRHAYIDKITSMVNKNKNNFALIFMDLDNFKTINDSLGHTLGDMLLQKVAKRLKNEIKEYDMLSRFGGDEFVFLFSNVQSELTIEKTMIKIHEVLKKPFILNTYEVYTTASIGIAIYPDDAQDAELLLRNADVAMYDAKQSGRSKYSFFNADMLNLSSNRLMLESELHKALENNELFLLFQPQVSLWNEKIVGVEALIRWQHPTKGLISPLDFIPIAENSGLIMPIGEWIIDQACDQLALWKDTHMSEATLSINVSAKQVLHQDLYSYIEAAIERTKIDGRFLELEITESVIMENINETVRILSRLKKLGVSIAIDDFGTGYSSLSYLKKLPIDKLKIDREFIKDIPNDKDDIAITNAIISMSKSLSLKIVAEGPETKEHIEFLQNSKCDIAQGFYYSKPITIVEVEKLALHMSK